MMLLFAETLWTTISTHVLDAVVNAAVLGVLGGGLAWLTASYRKFCSIDAHVKQLTTNMTATLTRLDNHEQRLNQHDVILAGIKGRESA